MFNFVKTTWQFVTNLVSTMTRFVKAQWSSFTALFTRNKPADTAQDESPKQESSETSVMPYEEHASASSSTTSTATTLSVLSDTTQSEAHINAEAVANEERVIDAPTKKEDELSSNESASTHGDNDKVSPAASNPDAQPTQRMDFKNLIALIGPSNSRPSAAFTISLAITTFVAIYYALTIQSTPEAAQNATTPHI